MILQKETFDRNFEVFLADTPEGKQIHYNLRYQVYCDEMGFEDKDQFPDKMESDEWDNHSVHFIVRHRASGQWLGGLRLVTSNKRKLPFEKFAKPYQEIKKTEREVSVEMSRLCVIKEARRFSSQFLAPYGLPNSGIQLENNKVKSIYNHKNQARSIMWGIFRAAALFSAENGIDYWYFIVAPALASFIRREGFEMLQIGDSCEHRGLRTPYRMDIENILANPLWLHDYKEHYSLHSDFTEILPYTQQVLLAKRA